MKIYVAGHIGSRGQSFSQQHEDQVMEMIVCVLPEVKMTERGYPILSHEASSPAHVNKKQLEYMM